MRKVFIAVLALLATGCGEQSNKGVALLVDVSMTYFDFVEKAQTGIRLSLAEAQAEDYYFVSVVGDRSFSQDAVVAAASMDYVPSRRIAQILDYKTTIETHPLLSAPQKNTDLRGGMLLAQQELSLRDVGRRYLIVFSDLDDDPASDLFDRPEPALTGYVVVLSSIKRLPEDNRDPARFAARIKEWQSFFLACGAAEVHIADEHQLRRYLK